MSSRVFVLLAKSNAWQSAPHAVIVSIDSTSVIASKSQDLRGNLHFYCHCEILR
ncbi:hypothetical protein [Helicobacter sp. T3_23-1056]